MTSGQRNPISRHGLAVGVMALAASALGARYLLPSTLPADVLLWVAVCVTGLAIAWLSHQPGAVQTGAQLPTSRTRGRNGSMPS